MSRRSSIQTTRITLDAIEDGVVRFVDGCQCAVLEVIGVNFGLQGETEQEATIAGYTTFLNSLTFPVQLVVRVVPVDLKRTLGSLEDRAVERLPQALAGLARDHAAYLRRLARNRTLLERRCFVVVPAEARATSRQWFTFGHATSVRAGSVAVGQQLTIRCDELARQLGRCGLGVRRLDSGDLAHLYYTCWCPELARVQRLRRALDDVAGLVVRGSPPPPGQTPSRAGSAAPTDVPSRTPSERII